MKNIHYGLLLSISFVTATAMDADFECYNSDDDSHMVDSIGNSQDGNDGEKRKSFLVDLNKVSNGKPRERKRKRREHKESEIAKAYANCSLCYHFFDGPNVREALKEHVAESHPNVLSDEDINKQIRKYIGFWRVESWCPHIGTINEKGKKCLYESIHYVPCNAKKPVMHHLIEHCLKFHEYLIDGNSLDEAEVKISGPFIEKSTSLSSKTHTSRKRNMSKCLFPKGTTFKITYKCPLYGKEVIRNYGANFGRDVCDFDKITFTTAANNEEFLRKISSIASNMCRHVYEQHEGKSVTKTSQEREEKRQDLIDKCIKWEKLDGAQKK